MEIYVNISAVSAIHLALLSRSVNCVLIVLVCFF